VKARDSAKKDENESLVAGTPEQKYGSAMSQVWPGIDR